MVNRVPASATAPVPVVASPPSTSLTAVDFNMPAIERPPPRKAHNSKVKFWHEKTFHGYLREERVQQEKLRKTGSVIGAPTEAKKAENLDEVAILEHHYIEDEEGFTVTTRFVREMGRASMEHFDKYEHYCDYDANRIVDEYKLLPQAFSDAYITAMEVQFPNLQECQDHWKSKKFATSRYKSWYDARYGNRKMRSLAKAAAKNVKEEDLVVENNNDDANRPHTPPPPPQLPVAKAAPRRRGSNPGKRTSEQLTSTPSKPTKAAKQKRRSSSNSEKAKASNSTPSNNAQANVIVLYFIVVTD